MKKTLLMLMLASMLAFTASAQLLQDAYWRAYDASDVPQGYMHITPNTLSLAMGTISFSTDNITFIDAETYSECCLAIGITDINPTPCGVNYTGIYTYTYLGDTLKFTLNTDSCSSRNSYFTTLYFLPTLAGIEDINSISTATIYPNPSADGIFNLMLTGNGNMPNKIYVLNVDGRKIMDETFSSAATNHSINLQSCASGIYFLVMENEKGRRVAKLVR